MIGFPTLVLPDASIQPLRFTTWSDLRWTPELRRAAPFRLDRCLYWHIDASIYPPSRNTPRRLASARRLGPPSRRAALQGAFRSDADAHPVLPRQVRSTLFGLRSRRGLPCRVLGGEQAHEGARGGRSSLGREARPHGVVCRPVWRRVCPSGLADRCDFRVVSESRIARDASTGLAVLRDDYERTPIDGSS